MARANALDEVDRAILVELQEDGRRAFREIARNVGVSERVVRVRVRKLQDAGVLRVLAFADPFALGHSVLALVLLRLEAGTQDAVVATLAGWPEVSYISSLLGRADVYVQVVCRDNESLWRLVAERMGALDGVIETETMLETKVHKFSYPTTQGLP